MTRPYLILPSDADYRQYYETVVCSGPLTTPHGIQVFFQRHKFEHAFFESPGRDGIKSTACSPDRAQRMSWIRPTLADPASDWHAGWDRSRRQVDWNRAVCITDDDFVVVISRNRNTSTRYNFITCFRADNSIGRIRQTPTWPKT